MKKIILAAAIFIAINNFCFSQEEEQETVSEKDNMKTVLHIHPMSLLFSALNSFSNYGFDLNASCYLTIEKPLSSSVSLLVRPSVWLNLGIGIFTDRTYFRGGSDIGFRFYPSRKGEGLYLQAQGGIFYIKDNFLRYIEYPDYWYLENKNYVGGDVMGYLGWSKKWNRHTLFLDFGLGGGNSNPLIRRNNPTDFGPVFDFNFGWGLRF